MLYTDLFSCLLILTAVSGVGSSPALATCETSKVLLAGVPGGFSRDSTVFAQPTEWPVSYELKYYKMQKCVAKHLDRKESQSY